STSIPSLTIFFFSSRRRHTSFSRDWSSDVCSSDLPRAGAAVRCPWQRGYSRPASKADGERAGVVAPAVEVAQQDRQHQRRVAVRSEERRVGKESMQQSTPCGRNKGHRTTPPLADAA